MTFNKIFKASCIAMAVAAAGAAEAAPFYIDFGGASVLGSPTGSTNDKSQMAYLYQSQTIITDDDGVAGISAGDSITTSIGLAVPGGGGLNFNYVTGFTPGGGSNGINTTWQLSFSSNDLVGSVVDISGGAVRVGYTSGLIKVLLNFDPFNDATTMYNFMNLKVGIGFPDAGGTEIDGKVDFTGVDTTFASIFHAVGADCGGDSSFYAMWSCDNLAVSFFAHQDTNIALSEFVFIGVDEEGNAQFAVSTDHDGSVIFSYVPEPGSLALVGLSLVGLGMSRRRKA